MTPVEAAFGAALTLIQTGYTVFPCGDDKRPSCPGGFKAATRDRDELIRLWSDYPGVLVGMPTGPANGTAVLDIDPSHGEAGAWCEAHRGMLPPTFSYATRRGGEHLWFRWSEGLRNSEGRIAKGIDVRGDGGYVIYWPAHGGEITCAEAFAPWPQSLTDMLGARTGATRAWNEPASGEGAGASGPGGEGTWHDTARLKAPDQEALAEIVRAMPNGAEFDGRGEWIALAHALRAAFPDDRKLAAELWLEHAAKREQAAGEPQRVWGTLQGPHLAGADWIANVARGLGLDVSHHYAAREREAYAEAAAAFETAGPVRAIATRKRATTAVDLKADPDAGARAAGAGDGERGEGADEAAAPLRPTIQVRAGQLSWTADMAEKVLLDGGFPVYARFGGKLVAPATRQVRGRGGQKVTATGFAPLGAGSLRDLLSRAADWVRWDARAAKLVPCDPPADVVMVLLERIDPRPFPEASGIVETPGLTPEGGISTVVGWDDTLGVHRVQDTGMSLPDGWPGEKVVKVDAENGLALLDGLLDGFPFVEDVDRSVALALLLTCLCRAAVPLAPIFAVSATDAGTGKSHLIDLAAVLATGRRCPAASAGESPEEFDKRMVGLIAAGYPMVSIDNVNGTIRSDALNQAVERDRLRLRLMGSSAIVEIESRAVFTANGNGIRLSGDLVRRTLPCRLDAGTEQPETRVFAFDPVKKVEKDRGPYVAAGLDMLRAHAAAGMPGVKGLRPLGSYEEWSAHVRGTLIWLGRVDPLVAMDRARAEDPDLRTLKDMLSGWVRRLGADRGYTAREAADFALNAGYATTPAAVSGGEPEDGRARADLLDAMLRAGGSKGAVDTLRLGKWLARNEGRVVGGMRFTHGAKTDGHHAIEWRVERIRPTLKLVSK